MEIIVLPSHRTKQIVKKRGKAVIYEYVHNGHVGWDSRAPRFRWRYTKTGAARMCAA